MNKNLLITTPIYYPSGKPHLGHAYTTTLADVISKFYQHIGYETFLISGSDEHGQKIQQKAQEQNIDPKTYVDEMCVSFVKLWDILDINIDKFVRTNSNEHIQTVLSAYDIIYKQNKIYHDKWFGWYCISCEENYNQSQIKLIDDASCCVHGHKLVEVSQDSYFLKMKDQVGWLSNLFENKNFIIPESRKNELINNFLSDLKDLSISRNNFDWGIKVPHDNKHVLYVWLDALLSYVSALGYLSNNDSLFQKFWQNPDSKIVHLMSKEITRFHCIYWPIILKYLGVKQPTNIISHGWIITKEGKMSKSLGNVIDPFELVNKFGSDAIRYFMIKHISMFKDSVFCEDNLVDVYNADLANNIGNLVSRLIGMLKKYTNGVIPEFSIISKTGDDLINKINEIIKLVLNYNEYDLEPVYSRIINFIYDINKYIEETKPWELFSQNKTKELNSLLSIISYSAYVILNLLSPILTKGSAILLEQLNLELIKDWSILYDKTVINNVKVNESKPIYIRLSNK